MENIIKVQDVTFEYRRTGNETSAILALDDISLDIEKGSFTAIIGVNGSGKSTLAKNMNGLMLPTGGKVYVKGMDTADSSQIWDIRQTVGMVFQNPDTQMVSAVVEDDIAFGPENLGIEPDEIRKRVDDALKAVGMYEYRFHEPHKLSGGQKQRVAIAGIMAMRTKCIVLDESTAMLDPKGREEVLSAMQRLNKELGITVVLITHYMEEAALADRVIVMNRGKVVLDGTPKEVFAHEKTIEGANLELPDAAKLAHELRRHGVNLPEDILTPEEFVESITSIISGGAI